MENNRIAVCEGRLSIPATRTERFVEWKLPKAFEFLASPGEAGFFDKRHFEPIGKKSLMRGGDRLLTGTVDSPITCPSGAARQGPGSPPGHRPEPDPPYPSNEPGCPEFNGQIRVSSCRPASMPGHWVQPMVSTDSIRPVWYEKLSPACGSTHRITAISSFAPVVAFRPTMAALWMMLGPEEVPEHLLRSACSNPGGM